MAPRYQNRQQGIALATALIFLIVITLLGLVAIRSSTTGLQLTLNEQSQTEALATAQSMINTVMREPGALPVRPGTDYKLCYQFPMPWGGDTSPVLVTCPNKSQSTQSQAGQSPNDQSQNADHAYVKVRRLPPETMPPPVNSLTSLNHFSAVTFAVRAKYDRSKQGLGAADIEEGVMKIVPNPGRTN